MSQGADWKSRSLVYRRSGDFPDTWRTADHRPVVAFFETDAVASLTVDPIERLPKLVQSEQIVLNRSAGPADIIQMPAPGSVMEKLAAAKRAEVQKQAQEQLATQMARDIVTQRSVAPTFQAGQVNTDAVLDALARIVSVRMAIQQRDQ